MKELALLNSRLDGRYDILKLLGRGSYAEIFVTRDNFAPAGSPDKMVVVKALNVLLQDEPDADLERTLIENFQNEAVALDRVRHKNVINRLGHGTARDLNNTIFHYIALEYLPGGDLAQLSKNQPLGLEKTLFYLEQICAGLAHAHQQGVIHRDIKPQNLLLTADRQTVKIADFGVAKFNDFNSPITRVGTNIYAAPEHSPLNAALETIENDAGEFRLTPAADVYSLAKTVYALLAGESPRRFSNQPITSFPPQIANQSWANDVLPVLERATQTDAAQRTATIPKFWQEMCAATLVFDEATCVAKSAGVFESTTGAAAVSANVPALPRFDSKSNVQIEPPKPEQLPERPRLVVGFDNAQKLEANRLAESLPNRKPAILSGKNSASPNRAANQTIAPPTPLKIENDSQSQSRSESFVARRARKFLRNMALRAAVVLIILGAFVGVLGGTYNYLQTRGYLPSSLPWLTTRKGTANQDGFLRASPGMRRDNIVGLVTKDSELKILGEEDNWYKVEIVRQGAPDKATSAETNGYVGKIIVDAQ